MRTSLLFLLRLAMWVWWFEFKCYSCGFIDHRLPSRACVVELPILGNSRQKPGVAPNIELRAQMLLALRLLVLFLLCLFFFFTNQMLLFVLLYSMNYC